MLSEENFGIEHEEQPGYEEQPEFSGLVSCGSRA